MELGNPAFAQLSRPRLLYSATFLSMNSVTASGLSIIDLTRCCFASQLIALCAMQLGSATMLTLVPVVIRMMSMRAIVMHPDPAANPFDLKQYSRIPKWLVEYQALSILCRVVALYQLLVHVILGGAMFVILATNPAAKARVLAETSSLAWFCVFTSVSAYTNCGYPLLSDSFIGLGRASGSLLAVVMLLVAAGNTMLPVFVRWAVVLESSRTADSSSRKVYLRYLLLNGRSLYPNLFSLQQTWALLIVQLCLTLLQASITLLFAGFHHEPVTVGSAIFMAVNTRHAGFASVDMTGVDAATLQLYVLMMFLAPSPFVAVLQSSEVVTVATRKLRQSLAAAVRTEQCWQTGVEQGPAAATGAGLNNELLSNSTTSEDQLVQRRAQFCSRLLTVMLTIGTAEEQAGAEVAHVVAPLSHEPECAHSSTTCTQSLDSLADAMTAADRGEQRELQRWEREIDTQLLLYVKYPAGHVRWRRRAAIGGRAVLHQLRAMATWLPMQGSMLHDICFVWLMCQLVLLSVVYDVDETEHWDSNNNTMIDGVDGVLFPVLFELVSAFGNVGLSLGSKANPDSTCSFSSDLNLAGQLLIMLAMLVGRTRGFPSHVDSSLELSWTTKEEILREVAEADRAQLAQTLSTAEPQRGMRGSRWLTTTRESIVNRHWTSDDSDEDGYGADGGSGDSYAWHPSRRLFKRRQRRVSRRSSHGHSSVRVKSLDATEWARFEMPLVDASTTAVSDTP